MSFARACGVGSRCVIRLCQVVAVLAMLGLAVMIAKHVRNRHAGPQIDTSTGVSVPLDKTNPSTESDDG